MAEEKVYKLLAQGPARIFNSYKDNIEYFWYSDLGVGHGIDNKRGFRKIEPEVFESIFISAHKDDPPLSWNTHLSGPEYKKGKEINNDYCLDEVLKLHQIDSYTSNIKIRSIVRYVQCK